MEPQSLYTWIADLILITHLLFVIFVVFGLVLVFAGRLRAWRWVRNPWLRATHLLGIGIVVVQSWLGVICPLTIWEMQLRAMAGDATYHGSFIAHWLGELLYFEAPAWVFVLIYSAFGLLVLSSWFVVRPRPFFQTTKLQTPQRGAETRPDTGA